MGNIVDQDNEPWWANWLAGPFDAILVASLFCFALAVAMMGVMPAASATTLGCIVAATWCVLIGLYYALRRRYNWYDDVPLVFGRDPPYTVSTTRFLQLYLAILMGSGRHSFEFNEIVERAHGIQSFLDGDQRLFRFTADMLADDSTDLDLSLETNIRSMVSTGWLDRSGQAYRLTDMGRQWTRNAMVEGYEQDEFIMGELARAMGTTSTSLLSLP